MLGVEAGGDGVDTDRHSATLTVARCFLSENLCSSRFRRPGPRYTRCPLLITLVLVPNWLTEEYWKSWVYCATDAQALQGFKLLSVEGIIPALESSHAIYAVERPRKMPKEHIWSSTFPVGEPRTSKVSLKFCPNWAQRLTGTCVLKRTLLSKLRETSKLVFFVESK